ncbi:MAG: exosortase T, partial [Myxococcales bacterium]|nr:exosortase T [Myxococcales bacterium]
VRAVRSGPAPADGAALRRAGRLFALTAAARLLGRLLAINLIGALALVIDVWALGLAVRVHRRPWALSPRALAALFAFSLPIEQVAQRVLGFPLRLLATQLAAAALHPFAPGLQREGTLLLHEGVRLSVDLPCSGAEGLAMLGALAAALLARRASGVGRLLFALAVTLGGALLANALRVVLLFFSARLDLPVFVEPGHSLVGLLALAAGALPLLLLVRRWPARVPPPPPSEASRPVRPGPVAALAFSAVALLVAVAPARPLDVGGPAPALALPARLGDFHGTPAAPSLAEAAYFARFGGEVQKAIYADDQGPPFVALAVRTTSPLRHLHGPDRCLIGAGHRVERLGVRPGPTPVVVWRSTGPDGRAWRVETRFLSAAGESAATVSEVVWRWLRRPVAWTLVERISPWSACEADGARCAAFDAALGAALDAW